MQTGVEFEQETTALLKRRGIQNDASFLAVLWEMDEKWQAFARHCNGNVNPLGYRIIMKELHPKTTYFAWPEPPKPHYP